MYKHIIAAVFVLTAVFSCDSPYAVQFQTDHREYPPGDPEVAALLHPTLASRIEFGFFKQVCPSKPLKSVEKAAKFIIASNFVKKALPDILGTSGVILLPAISVAASQMVTDSISPEAMSYETAKASMAAAIGTAMVSDYSCESVESAARTYYAYDRAAYLSDLCGGGNTPETLVKNLKKSRGEAGLIAVPFKSPIPPSFTEIYSRDSRILWFCNCRDARRIRCSTRRRWDCKYGCSASFACTIAACRVPRWPFGNSVCSQFAFCWTQRATSARCRSSEER